MKKGWKITLYVLGAFTAVVVVVSLLAGNYMVGYALTPADCRRDYDRMGSIWEKRIPGIYTWYNALHDCGVLRDTTICDEEGHILHAVYANASNPKECQGTAVLVHGYTDNLISMMPLGRMYRDSLNFNILAFDQEFHGKSEGSHIQMGWLDRHNAARWTEVAHELWPDTFMVVHGISMGAATVMMLSGDPDPEWVDAYIEDCGYTSVWNQFRKQLKEEFGLPAFPILYCADLICRCRYGWSFRKASSTAQLAKSTKPVLFIHGDSDLYVPTADIYTNFDAKTKGYRKMWLSEGAAHAKAFEAHPEEYTAEVKKFIEEVK